VGGLAVDAHVRQPAHGGVVAHTAVGDHADRAAHARPVGEDVTDRAGARIHAALDHKHLAGVHRLDRLTLRVVAGRVLRRQVVAQRDVAQGLGDADHLVPARAAGQPGEERVGDATALELRDERRRRRLLQVAHRLR
jgi:hypothetical protein